MHTPDFWIRVDAILAENERVMLNIPEHRDRKKKERNRG